MVIPGRKPNSAVVGPGGPRLPPRPQRGKRARPKHAPVELSDPRPATAQGAGLRADVAEMRGRVDEAHADALAAHAGAVAAAAAAGKRRRVGEGGRGGAPARLREQIRRLDARLVTAQRAYRETSRRLDRVDGALRALDDRYRRDVRHALWWVREQGRFPGRVDLVTTAAVSRAGAGNAAASQ